MCLNNAANHAAFTQATQMPNYFHTEQLCGAVIIAFHDESSIQHTTKPQYCDNANSMCDKMPEIQLNG